MTSAPATSRTALLISFAAIYLIWGSTYLAIRVAVETLPPFLLAAARFLLAGGLLYAWLAYKGRAQATPRQWRDNLIIGGLLLVGGNGMVVWAEQKIPSGITTLLLSVSPVIIVLIDWMLPKGLRPTWITFLGLALGIGGLMLLVGSDLPGGPALDSWRCAGLLFSCFTWSGGSLYSRYLRNPAEPMIAATIQMLLGGALLLIVALLRHEWTDLHAADLTGRSLAAWGYLVVAGSLIAYPCYAYLIKHTTPARVSTYAYVNPVVAVFLGWLILSEPVTGRTLVASVIIITAVVLITTQRTKAALKKA